ncbi:hypothetical protein SAMN05421736_102348 [Evansella caseinilytica]|uniref:NAD(P)-dependent dehydrogenase (Short-subunit alcohol dehydrogenase family) n=1 Tax=Evansella caseinilytica TaxID=1503961 RepID=A0A1H3L454_9BACI|nr:SDR family oxidoreductase [Evansella caseinilytica]SDY59026.1 hypothetical protein SAMN05421736_102348 [Evansella caseinilytica]
MTKWEKKVVLVTGAANGIGKAVAAAYAAANAHVFIVDIDKEHGESLAAELAEKRLSATFLYGDVAKETDVHTIFETMKQTHDTVDIIINNAGISAFTPLEKLSFAEWEKVIHTNVTSVFLFAKFGVPRMPEGAAIVNIASTRALMSEPNSEAYAASKGGIVALTHALAATLAKNRIRVNAISPGWIEAGNDQELREVDHLQHLSGRVGKPEDIVRACFYLTDPENTFVTGENLVIDGGMTKKMIYLD